MALARQFVAGREREEEWKQMPPQMECVKEPQSSDPSPSSVEGPT